jgi:hypothetical protein
MQCVAGMVDCSCMWPKYCQLFDMGCYCLFTGTYDISLVSTLLCLVFVYFYFFFAFGNIAPKETLEWSLVWKTFSAKLACSIINCSAGPSGKYLEMK